ncbi:MAG: ATP-grasp domain-containing protein [Pseudobdellovibrionaceae bacterium]
MPPLFDPKIKIGIVGGGQLARMLCLSLHQHGVNPWILSQSPEDPAAQVVRNWTPGDPQDSRTLQEFSRKVQVLTFESEFISPEPLFAVAKKTFIFPSPVIMKAIQFRSSQKELLRSFQIPTAPFWLCENKSHLDQAWKESRGHLVLKTLTGGYDGNGTFFPQSLPEAEELLAKVKSDSGLGILAELKVSFKNEVAFMLFRSSRGEKVSYPLVRTFQHQGRCVFVEGPFSHRRSSAMKKKLFQMMDKIDYVGALGVEMFDTGQELLVNELAPRVHNSGHYSQNSLCPNQFDLHWMCGLGLKLPKVQLLSSKFSMWNLLGDRQNEIPFPKVLEKGHLHLYGKQDCRPGRKMGHVNFQSQLPQDLHRIAKNLEKKK